ncbi:MAG: DUF3293 domain-containing protein [Verrucomicrobiales bacterium]
MDTGRTLRPEYRDACFRCPDPEPPAHFFIITAHNPDGEEVDDASNAIADAGFRREIVALGLESFPVTGGSPDFSHAEPGFGIVCTRETALSLARQFCQDAVFEVRHGKVILISALPSAEPDVVIGEWSDRLCE